MRGKEKIDLTVKMDERNNDIANDNSKLWPGFIPSPLTEDVRKSLKLGDKVKGVVVTNLTEKTPAASLRLSRGDIITGVNDVKISSVGEFYNALNTEGKSEIWFNIYSDGHNITTGKFQLD